MIDERFTRASRETQVTAIRIEKTLPGSMDHPKVESIKAYGLTERDLDGPIWWVWMSTKTGLDQSSLALFMCTSEAEAEKCSKEFPVGSVLPQGKGEYPSDLRELYKKTGSLRGLLAAGDCDFLKCYDCLSGAGVIGPDALPTKEVLEWCGPDLVAWSKSEFSENWTAFVEIAYCMNHFPRTSLATMASQIFYNYFIEQDDFSAGYLLRELEFLMGGAEEIATGVLGMRSKAGEAGSRASRNARMKRLELFMEEIERLGDLFPRIEESAILNQAFTNAVERDAVLWKQGKGQQADYEIALRSESGFKQRYFAIFK